MATHYRLMNEYGVAVPLWDDDGPLGEDRLPPELSGATREMLRAWAKQFEEHFDFMDGWDSKSIASKHARDAAALLAALRRELGPDADVELSFWEVG